MTGQALRISTQLRLAMALSALLVAVLGAVAWYQAQQMWSQTSGLYEHPMQVQMAIGDLRDDVGLMSADIRNLLLAKTTPEIEAVSRRIEQHEADAESKLAVIAQLYLGPRDDIDSLSAAVRTAASIRRETMRLARDGQLNDALARIQPGAIQDVQVALIRQWIQHVDDFATAKSASFYEEAATRRQQLQWQLLGVVATAILLTLAFSMLLVRGILTPLRELTSAAEQFRQGNLDVRSGYRSGNELGLLAEAFNVMADAIHSDLTLGARVEQVSGVMLVEEEAQVFCRALLASLMAQTNSQMGAIYLLNAERTAFDHFHSVGLGAAARESFSAASLEGELGLAVASRRIERLTDVPAGTRFAFAAVSGTITPREIVTIPIVADHSVSAVISLASLHGYDELTVRLIDKLWTVMTARLNGVLTFRRVQQLAEHLEHQNRELDAQKHELAAQAGEMSAQAGELAAQNAELERQKMQLDEANRAKSAFLANMSHELRTPLNSVIALAGVLHRRLVGRLPDEEYGYLEVIERNGRNLLALINDILDLSRIEAGRVDVTNAPVTVRDVVSEVLDMVAQDAHEKHLALRNDAADDLPAVTTDGDKLRHILQNLVGNAVKFTDAGSVIVSAAVDGEMMRIAVADTGIGISVEQLAHVFDEFRQADESTTRRYGGTGLGLAIARRYAELLGGKISVESIVGRGSTFTLRLPLTRRLMRTEATSSPTPRATPRLVGTATPRRGDGERILLVEDNEPAIIQLTELLQAGGYAVQVARNGREALERIGEQLPDAMILDLMMPEVDGFQVLSTVRGDPRTSHLPVLILTARLMSQFELSALQESNVQQLIQKGDINRAGLLDAVARMLAPNDSARGDASGNGNGNGNGQSGRAPAPTPAHSASHDAHGFRARRARPKARVERPLILVVEDNDDNRRTARALLADRFEVEEAADAASGLAQARRQPPDVILMDLALPGMDGVQALHVLREDDALKDVPVIAVTASAMKGDRESILAKGFDGYVSKPIDEQALHLTIAGVLG